MHSNKDSNLPIPVYLNQQIVFDLFAIKDDGFSMIRSVKTSASTGVNEEKSLEGGIGVNNAFAFLGIQFGAKKGQSASEQQEAETEQEKIHTPNSLFAKLRELLRTSDSIVVLNGQDDFNKLTVGQFVEFDATLSKVAMIAMLESFLEMMKLESLFNSSQDSGSKSSKGNKGNSGSTIKPMEDFLKGITPNNSMQLIGTVTLAPTIRAIISTKPDFFLDKDITEALDGEFRILGKITKVIKEGDNPINLLNRTSFSLLNAQVFDQLIATFKNAGNDETMKMLNLPELELEISPPALQLIPIAIFR